jgi:hypothetical protein
VVDLDATLGEKFLQVPVGQPVAQVPAHRQQDHLGREETEPVEPLRHRHGRSRTASALHQATLPGTVRCVDATEPLPVLGMIAVGNVIVFGLVVAATGSAPARGP